MHLEFVDISHARRVLQVRSKPAYGHRIKDAEEREMPLTAKLVKQLMAYKEEQSVGRRGASRLGTRRMPIWTANGSSFAFHGVQCIAASTLGALRAGATPGSTSAAPSWMAG